MYLIAAASLAEKWMASLSNWGQVAIGLGMVIFVHELGHFLVAKACGVKCEKFYLGFDIFGLKLARFRWGETEYGIGILPLGGYVKMLGQEDNPTKAAEEFERARLARDAAGGDVLPEGEVGAETSIFDPRSYLAKSVPQRMAIISAGVVMNVIFAFLVAAAAFGLGVKESPCVVGRVLPGDPAWRAGLRPGDEVIKIGETENPRFRDLQSGVALGSDAESGVNFVVRRPGAAEPMAITIHPDRSGLAPRIGVVSANTTTLAKPPVSPIAPLGGKDSPLHAGDVVAAVAGVNVETNADIQRELALHPGPTSITVLRAEKDGKEEQIAIDLPGRPRKGLGLVMQPGPIAAIQDGSPAAEAKLEVGDELVKIDGQDLGDPETLNDRLLSRAGQTVPLVVRRDRQDLDLSITLRAPYAVELPIIDGEPLAIGTMGLAIEVTNRVAGVNADSPAEKAGIKAGDEVVAAKIAASKVAVADDELKLGEVSFKFSPEKANWPTFAEQLQHTPANTSVELTLSGDRKVTLEPVDTSLWNPERGLSFEPLQVMRRAGSVGEAISLGSREAVNSVTQVYRMLRSVGRGDVSPKSFGGPVEIMRAAGGSARQGVPSLLMFLCMLSANLAVLNFLPIPLLDGGHMVFLILEGLRGKPVSERVVVAFHYAGFLLLISLMAFVFLLDFGVIARTP